MKTVFLCEVSIRRNLSSKLLKIDKEAETAMTQQVSKMWESKNFASAGMS